MDIETPWIRDIIKIIIWCTKAIGIIFLVLAFLLVIILVAESSDYRFRGKQCKDYRSFYYFTDDWGSPHRIDLLGHGIKSSSGKQYWWHGIKIRKEGEWLDRGLMITASPITKNNNWWHWFYKSPNNNTQFLDSEWTNNAADIQDEFYNWINKKYEWKSFWDNCKANHQYPFLVIDFGKMRWEKGLKPSQNWLNNFRTRVREAQENSASIVRNPQAEREEQARIKAESQKRLAERKAKQAEQEANEKIALQKLEKNLKEKNICRLAALEMASLESAPASDKRHHYLDMYYGKRPCGYLEGDKNKFSAFYNKKAAELGEQKLPVDTNDYTNIKNIWESIKKALPIIIAIFLVSLWKTVGREIWNNLQKNIKENRRKARQNKKREQTQQQNKERKQTYEESKPKTNSATDDYLKILGLTKGATKQQIKSQYSKLLKKYHPDSNGGDRSFEQLLSDIQHAYKQLNK